MQTLPSNIVPGDIVFEPGNEISSKYKVQQHLGTGAMGNVYLATHQVLSRPVAIKLLRNELCAVESVVARFIDEARVLATLKSPHTVRIIDAEVTQGGAFLVMEYVNGTDLAEFIAQESDFDLRSAIDIARQIACSLAEAHSQGIVHRDIKPENVLITRSDDGSLFAKVADFGIAKRLELSESLHRTMIGMPLGTPCYMAPEQFYRPKEVDQRADIFGLGVLIYELCTGRLPFAGEDIDEIMSNVAICRPVPAHEVNDKVPLELSLLVDRCLKPRMSDRFNSAGELHDELVKIIAQLDPVSGPRLRTVRPQKFSRSDARAETVLDTSAGTPRKPSKMWSLGLAALVMTSAVMVIRGSVEMERKAWLLWSEAAQKAGLQLSPDAIMSEEMRLSPRSVQLYLLTPESLPSERIFQVVPSIQEESIAMPRDSLAAVASWFPPKVAPEVWEDSAFEDAKLAIAPSSQSAAVASNPQLDSLAVTEPR